MNKMIVANLAYRPLRSLISIIAVAVEVTLILLIVGLATGMLNDARKRQEGTGADIIVRPPGSSNLIGLAEHQSLRKSQTSYVSRSTSLLFLRWWPNSPPEVTLKSFTALIFPALRLS